MSEIAMHAIRNLEAQAIKDQHKISTYREILLDLVLASGVDDILAVRERAKAVLGES